MRVRIWNRALPCDELQARVRSSSLCSAQLPSLVYKQFAFSETRGSQEWRGLQDPPVSDTGLSRGGRAKPVCSARGAIFKLEEEGEMLLDSKFSSN